MLTEFISFFMHTVIYLVRSAWSIFSKKVGTSSIDLSSTYKISYVTDNTCDSYSQKLLSDSSSLTL